MKDADVTLEGTADADVTSNVKGRFVAKVGDRVVLRSECLGCGS